MSRTLRALGTVGLAVTVSACAHGGAAKKTSRPKPGSAGDPVVRLLADAQIHLDNGLAESRQGHLNQARVAFDRAIDLYLSAPGGATADRRVAEAYRRALETIQVRELEALAAGDGFRETPSEPAAIDDLSTVTLGSSVPSDELRKLAEESLAGETNDVNIVLNDPVLSCIDLYQGPLRDWFMTALERGGRYLPRIREVFRAEGIPQDLAYLALVESAFKNTALSRAKAKGMWQFMPYTGRRFGLTQDWWVDERSSPDKATRAAAQYLKFLYETFGDWNLAMAAYNAGEGKVSRVLERTGAGDFWALRQTGTLALETRNYVPMIHAAIIVAKAPEKYGFEIQLEPALEYETVPVRGATDLRVIAECVGSGLDSVQYLNPELRRLATPANRTYDLRVPRGRASDLKGCLDRLPAEKRVTFRTHTLARGQTLSSVARLYGAKVAEIAQANGIATGKRLARGTELIIPVRQASAAPAVRPVRHVQTEEPDGRTRVRHRIQPGDTLTSIAARYNATVQELMSWNNLTGSLLAAGNTLTVYTRP